VVERFILTRIVVVAWIAIAGTACSFGAPQSSDPDINVFLEAASPDQEIARSAQRAIAETWRDGYAPMLLDMIRLLPPVASRNTGARRSLDLFDLLEEETGQSLGTDFDAWRRWTWRLPYDPHPAYASFKGALYRHIDPRMERFFSPNVQAPIRLDEVEWGGVSVNGIPPLDYPEHIPADEADYLEDNHVVFGISLNGEARAYPKRILAWHELARDKIGGVELTVIYCTLCGTVLPYESQIGGKVRTFGTSGLLYRSNKLFFDERTSSLWSTLEGRPVVGELVGSGLSLRLRPSVTTTWGEWRRQHPTTTVLSIDTGFERDYREGAAYANYFGTDELMFQVPETDDRLDNKDEVLVMLLKGRDSGRLPVAISTVFLNDNRVYHFEVAGRGFVVITSADGANRVYEVGEASFGRGEDSETFLDKEERRWRFTEDALVAWDNPGATCPRVTANRAFWFSWYAQFPETLLIQ
jgi:hypothetical protein